VLKIKYTFNKSNSSRNKIEKNNGWIELLFKQDGQYSENEDGTLFLWLTIIGLLFSTQLYVITRQAVANRVSALAENRAIGVKV